MVEDSAVGEGSAKNEVLLKAKVVSNMKVLSKAKVVSNMTVIVESEGCSELDCNW